MMDYELIRSRRRTVSLEVTKECKVLVRAPLRMSKREIDAFVPKVYYTVRADFGDYKGTYVNAKCEKRIDDAEAARAIAARASGQEGDCG